jgi:hypothetical protein
MEYCDAGSHVTLEAFEYNGRRWCPQHLPPPATQDNRDPGFCEVGRGHWAEDTVYIQSRSKRWCRNHFEANVREYLRRGGWKA